MKTIVPVLAAAALIAGCEDSSAPNAASNAANKGVAAVKENTAAAATALKDKAVATAQTAFDGAKKAMDDLTAKAASAPAEVKPSVDAAVATAKEKFNSAEKLLGDLKNATSDTWSKLSDEFSKAVASATDAIKAAMDKIPK